MRLVPHLTVIENNLFPPVIDASVDFDDWPDAEAEAVPVALPADLAALIAARTSAAAHHAQQAPRPGVIVRLQQPQPVAVLLTALQDDYWQGYLMAGETDYATAADVFLEEQDAPFDPQATVVQLWNPVRVHPQQIAAAIGALSPARLAAMMELAAQVQAGAACDARAEPGALLQQVTASGQVLLTGTPLGADHDPRRRYQALYHAVALQIHAAAPAPVAPATSWLEQMLTTWRDVAQRWQLPLEPVLQPTLGAALTSQRWRIGGLLELHLNPTASGDAVLIQAHWQPQQPVRVELVAADGQVRQLRQLDHTCPQGDLFIGADEQLTLRVYALDERLLFEAPFPQVLPN